MRLSSEWMNWSFITAFIIWRMTLRVDFTLVYCNYIPNIHSQHLNYLCTPQMVVTNLTLLYAQVLLITIKRVGHLHGMYVHWFRQQSHSCMQTSLAMDVGMMVRRFVGFMLVRVWAGIWRMSCLWGCLGIWWVRR